MQMEQISQLEMDEMFLKPIMKLTVLFFILLCVELLLVPAGAAPVTQPVTDISNRQVTFNANAGAGTTGWFEWGTFTGGPYYWTTPNQTIAGATFWDYQYGTPMLAGETYYVRACDEDGCGAEVMFVVSEPSMLNITHFGSGVTTIMRSGLNLTQSWPLVIKPYTGTMSTSAVFGLLFFFIFSGIWVRTKDITLTTMLASFSAGGIWLGSSAIGAPPDFVWVGFMLFVVSLAGLFYALFTR